jgi:hypothetical protein
MNAFDQNRETTDRYPIQLEPPASYRGEKRVSPRPESHRAPAAPGRNVTAALIAALVALADLVAVAAVIWWLSR